MNDRDIIELIYSAKQNRIDVFLNEGQLQVKLPKDKTFDKTILDQLKANKEALIAFLQKNERGNVNNIKITKADKSTLTNIPLSFSQERLWFVDQLEGTTKYHLPTVIRLKGQLNKEALKATLSTIISRHEILRTIILDENGQGYQTLLNSEGWELQILDGLKYKDDQEGLREFVQQLIDKPFDLSKDYMLRAHLIMLNEQEYLLLVTIHHIASDAWSMSILVQEVIELYRAFIENRPTRLEPLKLQYSDYAVWQRNNLQGPALQKKLDYWKQKLEGTTPLNLPTDFERPAITSSRGATTRFTFDKKLLVNLQQISQQYECTLFMTILAAFKVLLHRYTGQNDICVGTSVANRTMKEVEGLIGFFVNMLALRTELSNDLSFVDLLHRVKTTTLEAYENQDAPFEKVVDTVIKERDLSKNPLIQVMLIMLNTPEVPDLSLGDVTLSMENLTHTKTLFDLSVFMGVDKEGLHGWVEYSTDLFEEETINQIIKVFTELLGSIAVNPDEEIGLLPIVSEAEKQLLIDFNNNETFYPKDKTIVDLFEEQALKTPNSIAVIFEKKELTYQQLNERSNQLAHYLKSKGFKEQSMIAVCMERGVEMIISILGILKAGGAYVPIDPTYPAERIAFMLNDIAADFILCDKSTSDHIPTGDFEILIVDNDLEIIDTYSIENLKLSIQPSNLAYVMYTSGSTGRPKGVLVEHKNVVSLVRGTDYVSLSNRDILLATGSPSFDATTFEYWSMLLNGGQLVLCSENNLLDKEFLKQEIKSRGVTIMWFTSSWFNQLVDTDISVFETLNTLLVGGEKLSETHIKKMRSIYPSINIINGYGPTENTTFSLTYLISEGEITRSIPVGRPLNNRSAFILDQRGELVPIGFIGEIYLSGAGLAKGYLNNEELTRQKFVTCLFDRKGDGRMYKTGDLGRWRRDGNIEYLGRIDDQVKIRGFRIELGEIENTLGRFDGVLQNVVLAKEDKHGRKRLVAYVVAKDVFDREGMITFLTEKLPDYMVPTFWVELQQLPLTTNGKVDKKALPEFDLNEVMVEQYTTPHTETEAKLVEIWQELLDVERVGTNDNFFELGGDSILAIQFVSRSRNAGIEVKVADVFTYQTVAQLASLVDNSQEKLIDPQAEQNNLTGQCELLPVQQWYFETQQTALSHFNQSVLLSINKTVTEAVLNKAVERIVAQHDALRFKYNQKDGHWMQEYGSTALTVATEDLTNTSPGLLAIKISEIADRYQRSLNIENGEIIRVVWMQTPDTEKDNRLLIIIHHLAVDGVSWRILLEGLDQLLTEITEKGETAVSVKTSSYKQWYNALSKYGKTNRLTNQKSYWQNTVNHYKPFTTDTLYNGKVKVKETTVFTVKLEATVTRMLLKEVPRVYHTEINDILLAALAKTLCSWSKTGDVIIGLEGHGREDIDDAINLSRTVGWFTSLFPVLLSIGEAKDDGDLIKTVKEQLRQVPDKGLGYGVLRYVNSDSTLPNNDPWDIQFNYLGQLDNVVKESKWMAPAGEATGAGRNEDQEVNEKLSVNCHIKAGQLFMSWRFSTLHYREETIKRLAATYISNLEVLVNHCIEQGKLAAVYTPSDYGLGSAVSYEELDAFLEEDNMDNIMSF